MEAGCGGGGGGEVGRFRHITADTAKVPFCMCDPVASVETIK